MLFGLGCWLGGCGDAEPLERDVVARIDTPGGALELDRRVVQDIATSHDLDQDQAQARALDLLRWVAARRVEIDARETPPEHADDLDPSRREHLERAALVRLWLREVFEPAHAAATIPRGVVEQSLADPSLTRRLFHPELWFVCQALIVPRETDDAGRNLEPPSPDGDGGEAEAEAWRAQASEAFAPLVARIQAVAQDFAGDDDCEIVGRIIGLSERDLEASSLTIRFEHFAFAPSEAHSFDPTWVEHVTKRAEPGVVGPFSTRFGLHLVVVTEIKPAALNEGSMAPDQLAAAREAEVRSAIETPWRADQLQRRLAELRDRRIVRVIRSMGQAGSD